MSAIAERYSRAARSSNLKLDDIKSGDVDVLIAAGMVRETLATRLVRLRCEFDQVRRGESGITLNKPGIPRLLMPVLASLPKARHFLTEWAIAEGSIRGITIEQAQEVAAKVLDIFLDGNCPTCSGRGFSGGYGLPNIRCTDCRESGRRTAYYRTENEESFAKWLQANMEAKVDRALGHMRRMLRNRG